MDKQIHVMRLLQFSFVAFREVPSCVNTVTFCQFLFIALEGFIFTANFGFKKPVIPIRYTYNYLLNMYCVERGKGDGGGGGKEEREEEGNAWAKGPCFSYL